MKPKQEQIKEMVNAVVRSAVASKAKIDDKVAINLNEFVKNLYNLGYRKASDVIDELQKECESKEEAYNKCYSDYRYWRDRANKAESENVVLKERLRRYFLLTWL